MAGECLVRSHEESGQGNVVRQAPLLKWIFRRSSNMEKNSDLSHAFHPNAKVISLCAQEGVEDHIKAITTYGEVQLFTKKPGWYAQSFKYIIK